MLAPPMAQRAKALRAAIIRKLGAKRVAYECDVSATAVQNWLNGAPPKAKHLLKLAKLAGLPVDPRVEALAPADEG